MQNPARIVMSAILLVQMTACDLFRQGSSAETQEKAAEAPAGTTGPSPVQKKRRSGQQGQREEQPQVTWQELKPGTGDLTSMKGSVMKVSYKVWLKDSGTLVEDSRNREKEFSFTLGDGSVIPGWDQGLAGMKKGGIRHLEVPPALAYGKRGISGLIPPDSALTFEIELIDLRNP